MKHRIQNFSGMLATFTAESVDAIGDVMGRIGGNFKAAVVEVAGVAEAVDQLM
ncbi:MAG TPA: hypothetical protein VK536_04335 [Candidatus Limnocylindrales bacterium]|nr:hypothetical protein [Candidatus Limnocylindrales bacterium]